MEAKLQPFMAHYDSLQANIQEEDGFLRELIVSAVSMCLSMRVRRVLVGRRLQESLSKRS